MQRFYYSFKGDIYPFGPCHAKDEEGFIEALIIAWGEENVKQVEIWKG